MAITVLSRSVLTKPLNTEIFVSLDLDLERYGCTRGIAFLNKKNQNLLTVITDWRDTESATSFFNSDQYESLRNKFYQNSNPDREFLILRKIWNFSELKSEFFSLAKTYIGDYNKNLSALEAVYNKGTANQLGILRIKLYTAPDNDRVLITLTEWENEDAFIDYPNRGPSTFHQGSGYEINRYGLMTLTQVFDTKNES